MSDVHLLDEYLIVFRDAGRRHMACRIELERRLAELDRLRAIEAAAKTWMEWGGHCPTCAFVRHREGNPQLSLEMLWDYCDCGWHAARAALAARETP
jgi:hypothetical protein